MLEGSVRKSGNMLRISAQLVRASDSTQLWSAIYDREFTDVFKVQDEIAGAVVAALKVQLLPAQHVANPHRTADSRRRTRCTCAATSYFNRASSDGYRLAIDAYRQAIALDPITRRPMRPWPWPKCTRRIRRRRPPRTTPPSSVAWRQRTRRSRSRRTLADGYTARGWMRSNFTWDWAGAQADLDGRWRSIRATARCSAATANCSPARAVWPTPSPRSASRWRSIRLSAPPWSNLGYYLAAAGQWAKRGAHCRVRWQSIRKASTRRSNLATLELLEGHADIALAMFRRDEDTFRPYGIALAEHSLGHARESQQALDELIADFAQDSAIQIADVYAWRGEKEKAFQWLDRAYAQRDGGMSDLAFDPLLVSLHPDPRFADLLRRIGLPQAT